MANREAFAVRFWQYFGRALVLRCPSCGQFTMVRGFLKIHEQCRACGLFFVHDAGFWQGAWYFNWFVASLLATLPAMLCVATGVWGMWFAVLYGALVAGLFPLVFYWHAHSLWIASFYYCVPDDLRMGRDLAPLQHLSPSEEKALPVEERQRRWAEEALLDLEGDRRSRV
jgi:uncharacterized protein (DUF983 family)